MAAIGGGSLAHAMGFESVTVYVGSESKRYLIHKALLTTQSEYFDKALNGPFKEAEEQSIHLEEESPAAFDLLVGWLYQDRIPVVPPQFGGAKGNTDTPTVQAVEEPAIAQGLFGQRPRQYIEFGRSLFGGLPAQHQLDQIEMAVEDAADTKESNNGTARITFYPNAEVVRLANGRTENVYYYNISAQKEYRHWSPEELRVADYLVGVHRPPVKKYPKSILNFNQDGPFTGIFGTPHVKGFSFGRPCPEASLFAGLSKSPQAESSIFGGPFAQEDLSDEVCDSSHIEHSSLGDPPTVGDPFKDYPTQGQRRIPGIPQCLPMEEILTAEEAHQLSVLQLCLLAETICWDKLFNCAMDAYIQGEANLSRPILPDHIELIYQRAHEESPCRSYAADAAVSRLHDPEARAQYTERAQVYPAFLRDTFRSMGKGVELGFTSARPDSTNYRARKPGEHSPRAKGKAVETSKETRAASAGPRKTVTWKHKRGEGPIDPREKMAFNPDNPGVRWNYYYPSDEEMSGEDEPERDETERF